MKLPYNLKLSEKVIIKKENQNWIGSDHPGVKRAPLEREKKEAGRTTSIVTYEPGATFAEHTHPGGEEIYVIEGEFADEHGSYQAGTYIRNPTGSKHSPFSKTGCKIFVKLNQFQIGDNKRLVINTNKQDWLPGHGNLTVMPLHSYSHESAALVKWPKGEIFIPHSHFGGEEILVLTGKFKDEHGEFPKGTWIRSPHMSTHHPFVDEETIILVKVGHLPIDID